MLPRLGWPTSCGRALLWPAAASSCAVQPQSTPAACARFGRAPLCPQPEGARFGLVWPRPLGWRWLPRVIEHTFRFLGFGFGITHQESTSPRHVTPPRRHRAPPPPPAPRLSTSTCICRWAATKTGVIERKGGPHRGRNYQILSRYCGSRQTEGCQSGRQLVLHSCEPELERPWLRGMVYQAWCAGRLTPSARAHIRQARFVLGGDLMVCVFS